MKVLRLTSLMALVALAASNASAAILAYDNFDSYANQAAFEAVWPDATAPGGTLSTSAPAPYSSPNSINFGTAAARSGRTTAETGLPTQPGAGNAIRFAFMFYDSNASAAPYRQFSNLQDGAAPTLTGQLVSMGLNNNLTSAAEGGNYYMARILGVNGSAYFKLNNPGSPLRSTGWHNLAVIITNTDYKFYVDGFLAKTQPNTAPRSYETLRLGSGLSSTTAANFDNFKLATIPEPATFVLAGLGLVGVGFAARKRK